MIATVAVVIFVAATIRLFAFPARGMPAHADAVAMFDGTGNSGRLATALRLAREAPRPDASPFPGTKLSESGRCPPSMPDVRVICFNPSPATTQGEAEFVGPSPGSIAGGR
jgi:hypothetical protein